MNELKNCVIVYDNNLEKYVDKSREIKYIYKDLVNRKFIVNFNNGTTYPYNMTSIEWITDPEELDIKDSIIYANNKRLFKVSKVLKFDNWRKVIFEDNSIYTYHKNDFRKYKNLRNEKEISNFLSYLQEVSMVIDKENEMETKFSNEEFLDSGFVKSQLDNIEISEESVLSYFLSNKSINTSNIIGPLIFPLDTNAAQIKAVKNALSKNISVIQGPPGTGKTQTILNIIANLLIRNKKVAVVSGNNEATRNVQEKLAKNDIFGIDAYLGKNENIQAFFEKSEVKPNFNYEQKDRISENVISNITNKVIKVYESRIKKGKISEQIKELKTEFEKFNLAFNNLSAPKCLVKWQNNSDMYLKLSAFLETLTEKRKISIVDKFKLLFDFKIFRIKSVLNNIYGNINYLQSRYYQTKLAELERELESINVFLTQNDNEQNLSDFKLYSMNYFKQYMTEYYEKISEYKFDIKNYKQKFNEFNRRYPVIYSTTHSLHKCSGNYLYDYVIIDESSQVDLASAVIAMSCAKNIVFVGDLKQLPHVVKSTIQKPLYDIFKRYSLPVYLNYADNSILRCVIKKFKNQLPKVLLNEHYRCDSQIIDFCNKRFYNGELLIQTEHKKGNGIFILETLSNSEDNRKNQRQLLEIQKILPLFNSEKIGIISPYRNQVNYLTEKIKSDNILVDTVHKFQGKEKDIIFLSTVADKVLFYDDDKKIDFLNRDELINVAISRAQNKLYVVASTELLNQQGTIINDLYRYISYYGDEHIIKGQVYSVFDLMYEQYSPLLEELKKNLLKVSKYPSENIIATLVDEVCKSEFYSNYKFLFNYPLHKFINVDLLDNVDDKNFVQDYKSHGDFVFYNKLDKSVRLIIEVDGKNHDNPLQNKRDAKKDRILQQLNIPILRLSTHEFDCKEKIEEAMKKGFEIKTNCFVK